MSRARLAFLTLFLLWPMAGGATSQAGTAQAGRALLEKNCARCHAIALDPLKAAPNLWIVLRSYPTDRLEFELAEGIGSRHREMPQIQFTSEEISAIEAYLSGE